MSGSVIIPLRQQMKLQELQTTDMLCCCRVAPDTEALRRAIRRAMVAHAIIRETRVAEAMEAAETEGAAAMEAGGAGEVPLGELGSQAAVPQPGPTPLPIWTETAEEATANLSRTCMTLSCSTVLRTRHS